MILPRFFRLVFTLFLLSETAFIAINAQTTATNFHTFFPDSAMATVVAEHFNRLPTDAVTPTELAGLRGYLGLGSSEIADLTGIRYLTGIDSLGCHKNEVTVLPAEIGNLTQLTYLNLSKTFGLSALPAEIGRLTRLKVLYVALTELSALPSEIGQLTQLEVLGVCCNGLSVLPPEIGRLTQLRELDVHSNALKTLPAELCRLRQLRILNLSYCLLTKLPDDLGQLSQLEQLNLFGNDLRTLPKSISKMTKLRSLNVYDNFKLSEQYKAYLPPLLRKNTKKN